MNPLESTESFSLTLANPNPKFRPRKDGDRWFIEFEVSAEEAGYFIDPNINRKGMVIEAIHCEVTNLNATVKESSTVEKKGGPLAKLAGMFCGQPEFWTWLWSAFDAHCENETDAREVILTECSIQSRAELDHDGRAKRIFEEKFRRPYASYLERGQR